MAKIEFLEWDTNFFKKKIYRVSISDNELWDYKNILDDVFSLGGELIYLFSSNLLPDKEGCEFLVDKKVKFYKKISNITADKIFINVEEYTDKTVSESLKKLALISGQYSRFKDKRFPKNTFQNMYLEWIKGMVEGRLAQKVFVIKRDGREVAFVGVSIKGDYATIPLIAVGKEYQGKGFGKALLLEVERYLYLNKIKYLYVDTQVDNIGACKFYIKMGFDVNKIEYVYHFIK